MVISLVIAILVVAIDQLSKFLVYGTAAKSIVGNVLWFQSTLNTGVAFSMFEGGKIVFIAISTLASIVLAYLIISKKWMKTRFSKISIALILGGTISNLIDRIALGGVRDFI